MYDCVVLHTLTVVPLARPVSYPGYTINWRDGMAGFILGKAMEITMSHIVHTMSANEVNIHFLEGDSVPPDDEDIVEMEEAEVDTDIALFTTLILSLR